MMSQSFRLRFRAITDYVRLRFRVIFADRIGESIILYTKDVAERDGVIHLPIYMAMFL